MKSERSAVTAKLAAFLKSSFLNNLDRLHKFSARKAITDLKVAVHSMIAERRTPGAFGSARPSSTRPQYRGNKLARYVSSAGRVRGY